MNRPSKTTILPADDAEAVERAAAVLKAGGLVAFPTDTVYGLGAHGFQPEAVESIYRVKGRMAQKAIPLLLGSLADVEEVAQNVPDTAWQLAERFWPGGLTLVLRRRPNVPDAVTSGGPTVAVRIPDHPVPLRLISLIDAPLAATSANRSGQPSPVTADEVRESLNGLIDVLLDGGTTPGGVESTVLDLSSSDPVVLRRGAVPVEELEKVLGRRL
ncbi:MAG: L-threonylcarbamoyladenylate synthase [Chloroflexota bacterium]